MQVKGHAAPETIAAADRASFMIEQAEALGEPLEDPLLLFSVLYGIWVTAHAEFKTDTMRSLAAQFLTLAQKQATTVPLMVGHRLMGSTLMFTGNLAEGRAHYDEAAALYDPAAHRALAKPFGQDVGVATLSCRSSTLWLLGYPDSARRDNKHAVQYARDIGHTASLMLALAYTSMNEGLFSGDYLAAQAAVGELTALADDKGALVWQITATFVRGCLFALTNKSTEAVQEITSSLAAYRSTGARMFVPIMLVYLSRAHAATRQFDRALCAIAEAMTTLEATGERWVEAEVNRVAGELTLSSPMSDAAKAEEYFERSIAVARRQQAKLWELRAAMSLARLWRDQDKRDKARNMLTPVYNWFTEGFDALDLREAKALLESVEQ
jgi:predicted ATPase